MFFRIAAAIGLATAIGLTVIAVEKQKLTLRQKISLQHYQLEVLNEQKNQLVLETQQLTSPLHLMDQWKLQQEDLKSQSKKPFRKKSPSSP
ncbi:hypothetical protein SH668x_001669 [Planctomicrobium sp. SH668]|uniref:hypothetical protein n=1 Tax=Planctomicrobium sp. SH668 TaxID=3448126 RepID=UPI003F5B3869